MSIPCATGTRFWVVQLTAFKAIHLIDVLKAIGTVMAGTAMAVSHLVRQPNFCLPALARIRKS